MESTMQFSFDVNALGVIVDLEEGKALGTGFSLLQPGWVVTAKHVVLVDSRTREGQLRGGLPRRRLAFQSEGAAIPARVHAVHPEVDLAVVELIESSRCKVPFYPSYAGFTAADGLFSLGYSPTLTNWPVGPRIAMQGHPITKYTSEIRERSTGPEDVIEFEASVSEGGNSGCPVFGSGGGVVGVVLENYKTPSGVTIARATSLVPLLRGLLFRQKWRVPRK
jgi:S1-C subfamily serine protease